jgi:hypothetical protein
MLLAHATVKTHTISALVAKNVTDLLHGKDQCTANRASRKSRNTATRFEFLSSSG